MSTGYTELTDDSAGRPYAASLSVEMDEGNHRPSPRPSFFVQHGWKLIAGFVVLGAIVGVAVGLAHKSSSDNQGSSPPPPTPVIGSGSGSGTGSSGMSSTGMAPSSTGMAPSSTGMAPSSTGAGITSTPAGISSSSSSGIGVGTSSAVPHNPPPRLNDSWVTSCDPVRFYRVALSFNVTMEMNTLPFPGSTPYTEERWYFNSLSACQSMDLSQLTLHMVNTGGYQELSHTQYKLGPAHRRAWVYTEALVSELNAHCKCATYWSRCHQAVPDPSCISNHVGSFFCNATTCGMPYVTTGLNSPYTITVSRSESQLVITDMDNLGRTTNYSSYTMTFAPRNTEAADQGPIVAYGRDTAHFSVDCHAQDNGYTGGCTSISQANTFFDDPVPVIANARVSQTITSMGQFGVSTCSSQMLLRYQTLGYIVDRGPNFMTPGFNRIESHTTKFIVTCTNQQVQVFLHQHCPCGTAWLGTLPRSVLVDATVNVTRPGICAMRDCPMLASNLVKYSLFRQVGGSIMQLKGKATPAGIWDSEFVTYTGAAVTKPDNSGATCPVVSQLPRGAYQAPCSTVSGEDQQRCARVEKPLPPVNSNDDVFGLTKVHLQQTSFLTEAGSPSCNLSRASMDTTLTGSIANLGPDFTLGTIGAITWNRIEVRVDAWVLTPKAAVAVQALNAKCTGCHTFQLGESATVAPGSCLATCTNSAFTLYGHLHSNYWQQDLHNIDSTGINLSIDTDLKLHVTALSPNKTAAFNPPLTTSQKWLATADTFQPTSSVCSLQPSLEGTYSNYLVKTGYEERLCLKVMATNSGPFPGTWRYLSDVTVYTSGENLPFFHLSSFGFFEDTGPSLVSDLAGYNAMEAHTNQFTITPLSAPAVSYLNSQAPCNGTWKVNGARVFTPSSCPQLVNIHVHFDTFSNYRTVNGNFSMTPFWPTAAAAKAPGQKLSYFVAADSSVCPFNAGQTGVTDGLGTASTDACQDEYLNSYLDTMSGMMDWSVDPCEDPYMYACGGFVRNFKQKLSDGGKYVYSFSPIAEAMKTQIHSILTDRFPLISSYYSQCVDTVAIEKLGWQPTLGPWIKRINESLAASSTSSMAGLNPYFKMLGQLQINGLARSAFWEFDVSPNSYASEVVMRVQPSGATLRSTYYYNNGVQKSTFNETLITFFTQFGYADPVQAASNVFEVELYLAKVIPFVSGAPYSGVVTPTNVSPAASSWLEGLGYTTAQIPQFTLYGIQYFQNLDLTTFTKQALADYLVWQAAWSLYKDLPSAFRTSGDKLVALGFSPFPSSGLLRINEESVPDELDEFLHPRPEERLRRVQEEAARWQALGATTARQEYCMNAILYLFADLLTHQWVVEDFPAANRPAAESLVANIYAQLGVRLNNVKFLTPQTQQQAIKKWQLIDRNVGYDSDWIQYIDQEVTGVLLPDDTALFKYKQTRDLATVGSKPVRNKFPIRNMLIQNAFYMPSLNNINLLAGLLVAPMFDPKLPPLFLTARYGYVMGHEMTHGFDNNGRLFNGTGAYVNWWDPTSIANFNERAQCFIDQYSSFTYYGQHINGAQTLPENIADNGGVRLSWMAYDKYIRGSSKQLMSNPPINNDQLFWLQMAQTWCTVDTPYSAARNLKNDVHSPSPARIRGPFSNNENFAKTFSCPPSSKMGRSLTSKVCELW